MIRYNILIGISEFEKIRKNDYYYVDKTELIQALVKTEPAEITLFTRPRRFGKTLVMSMLASFFDIRRDSRDLFEGLKIAEDQKLCELWMNQWPVIFLSLKDAGGESFEDAYGLLQSIISQLYVEHAYLEKCTEIDESYKEIFARLKRRQGNKTDVQISLRILMRMMQIYYGKQVILLIDEYDVPMAKAGAKSYYNEMLDVIGTMMSQALKDNASLKFSVITGCLRISKESIFTGTIADERFSSFFGFTDEEVRTLLENTGNLEYFDRIKKWYDGYCFGKTEIMDIFRKSVVCWFDERIAVRDRSELFKALWNEDAGRLSDLISELLFETISYHDYAESMQKAEERALNQIEEMRYADGMYAQGYQKVIKYGAAFYRKSCLVGRCEI